MSYVMVYVPADVMNRLESQLQNTPEKIPAVLKKLINDTAKRAKKESAARTREVYVVKTGAFNKSMKIENATQRNLQAMIYTEGNQQSLYEFKRRKNSGKKAARAQVLTTGTLKELVLKGGEDNGKDLKAFVQTIKDEKTGSEHTGIFQRMTSAERSVSSSTKRNAIKQLYGISIPQMVENEKVYSKIEKDIREELREGLAKHIAAVMEGTK